MTAIRTIEGDFIAPQGRYALVVGRFNSFVVESLVAGAVDVSLWAASVAAVVWLPPAMAVTAVVAVLALQHGASAFIGVAWTSWPSSRRWRRAIRHRRT